GLSSVSFCSVPGKERRAVFFFFFSSRRRHTRFSRDWSSDVCSSDLRPGRGDVPVLRASGGPDGRGRSQSGEQGGPEVTLSDEGRSEERRVGKECRSRWSRWR